MHPSTRSSLRSAVLGGLLVVGAVGCTADRADTAALDRATGAVLADAADRLASALESDDPCQALAEVDELRARADAAQQAGEAPEEVVAETVRVARAVTAGVVCDDGPVALDGEDVPAGAAGTGDATEDDVEVEAAPVPAAPTGAPPGPAEAAEDDARRTSGDGDRDSARSGGGSGDAGDGGGNGSGNAGGNGTGNAGGNGNGNAGGGRSGNGDPGGNGNGRGNGGRG